MTREGLRGCASLGRASPGKCRRRLRADEGEGVAVLRDEEVVSDLVTLDPDAMHSDRAAAEQLLENPNSAQPSASVNSLPTPEMLPHWYDTVTPAIASPSSSTTRTAQVPIPPPC